VPDPLRGLEAVLPHQPADALLRGPDALVAEPSPDLAIALAVERRPGQDAPDVAGKFLVQAGTERAALPEFRPFIESNG
jgi:hypothetical protein